MHSMNSLRSKLILYLAVAAILITAVALVLGYYTTRRQLFRQLEARAGALTDQISYAFEALIDGDDLFPIQRIIEQTAALEDVFAVAVVDRDGKIMAHNDRARLGQVMVDPLIPLAVNDEQRVSEFTTNRFVIVDPLTGQDYSLIYHSDVIGAIWIEMDLSTLTGQLQRQYALLVGVMVGLVSLLSLAALWMLQNLIINRLQRLQCGLKQLESGDLTYRLADLKFRGAGDDEIASLALSFNQMADSLQTRTEQRQQAEARRRASEARLTTMLDTAADAIFTVDARQKITTFNRGAEKIFGYQAAEIVGQSMELLIPPEARPKHRHNVTRFATANSQSRFMGDRPEITGYRKDGQTFPAEATLSKLEQDKETSFTVILRDITERKQVEKALRESRERLTTVVKAAKLGLWDWNIQTGDVIFNERWAEMLGYTLDEIDSNVTVWENLLHPDDKKMVMDAITVHLEGRTPFYSTEHRLLHKDGHWVWVYDAGQVSERDATGQPLRAAGIHVDITERKQAEEALRQSEARNMALLNAMPDLMFRLGNDGTLLDYKTNDAQQLFVSPSEVIGQHLGDILPANVAESAMQTIADTLFSGQMQMFEYKLSLPDGTHTYEARLVVIEDDEVLAIVRDISERARLEQMKTDFIHRASHELRTPLTTSMMMVELIREGGEAEELGQYWEILELEMERQRELIEDLLTVGRLESGTFQLNPIPLQLAQIFQNVSPAVETQAEMKNIRLEWHIHPELPPINGDANGLQQVFINLLSNSIKFSVMAKFD